MALEVDLAVEIPEGNVVVTQIADALDYLLKQCLRQKRVKVK